MLPLILPVKSLPERFCSTNIIKAHPSKGGMPQVLPNFTSLPCVKELQYNINKEARVQQELNQGSLVQRELPRSG